jgi:protein-L-isoaspartate(D-aspartate) O-methyltransferase
LKPQPRKAKARRLAPNPEFPMIDFAAARKKMVENQLRTSSITDRRLLAVMAEVPRELFVPENRRDLAYIDEVHLLPAAVGRRYLPAPAPFARLVQLARIATSDKVLDVGCATGYSAAVLAALAASVVAIESEPGLAAAARANLAALSIDNVHVLESDLDAGDPAGGPYDVIMLEGLVDRVPSALLDQLAENGRLVALERQGATAVAHLYVKSARDVASRAEFNTSLPPLNALKAPPTFTF